MGCSTKSLYKSVETLDPNWRPETAGQKKERERRQKVQRRKEKLAAARLWIKKKGLSLMWVTVSAVVVYLVNWLLSKYLI